MANQGVKLSKLDPRGLKRVLRDYNEFQNNPLPGLAMVNLDSSYQHFMCNIEILSGIYKGVKMQIKLDLPGNFPLRAPYASLMPHQQFRYPYHHHIFGTKICIDILSDAWMSTGTLKTGWTSAYTFTTILLQLQSFISDPDLPRNYLPNKTEIGIMKQEVNEFKSIFTLNGQKVVHTWEKPIPAFPDYHKAEEKLRTKAGYNKEQRIRERLTCFSLKENIVDFHEKDESGYKLALGYPIHMEKDKFDRLHPIPIPDILSFQGYKSVLLQKKNNFKIDKKTGLPVIVWNDFWTNEKQKKEMMFKGAYGDPYNTWIPIYVNKKHFIENLERINQSVGVLKYGQNMPVGSFHPGMVLEVLPTILNKLVVYLLDGTVHKSVSAIEAYIHFAKLFREYLKFYKDECQAILNEKFSNFLKHDAYRSKRAIGDIGEFVQILMICKDNFYEDKTIMSALFREAMARQVLWIVKQKIEQQYKPLDEKTELNFSFNTQLVSVRLFMFVVEVAKKFGKAEFLDNIEDDFCIVNERMLLEFIRKIKDLSKYVKSYEAWFSYLGFDDCSTDVIFQRLVDSYKLSNEQGYTFDEAVPNYAKMKETAKSREEKQAKKNQEMLEKAKIREERKQKRDQQRKEQDEKDLAEILKLSDQEKAIEESLDKVIEQHDNAREKVAKTLEEMEKELYNKYFDENDPFAYYKDPKKTKKYEKELEELKQSQYKQVIKLRAKEFDLQDNVDDMYDKKIQSSSHLIQERKEKREKEELEKQKAWNNIQIKRQIAWEAQQRKYREERQQAKEKKLEAKKQHRQKTNNGLGYNRVQEIKKEEKIIQKQKKLESVKNNVFYALMDDDEEENALELNI